MTLEQLQPYCDEAFQNSLARSIVTERVLNCIKENAVIEIVEQK